MTADTKTQLQSSGKTLGVIAAAGAVVGVVAHLVLAPAPVKTVDLLWNYPAEDLPQMIFEIVSKTNLADRWQVYTNVTGTNRLTLPANKAQEFFTISRVIWRGDTNQQLRQAGF